MVLFVAGDVEELVKHGLRALRDTLPNEVELTTKVSAVISVLQMSAWHPASTVSGVV